MDSLKYFSKQLKRASLRKKQVKANSKATTIVSTVTTATKTKLTDDQYRNIILAKSMAYLQQKGVM